MRTVVSNSADHAVSVWLVWSGAEAEARSWEALLAQTPLVLLGRIASDAASLAALKRGPENVLLLPVPPAEEAVRQELHRLAKGVVAVAGEPDCSWVENVPAVLVAARPSAEALHLAVCSAAAAARREFGLRSECEQLQQKLQDRILLDRAKGILARRLGLSEEEAYHRLRNTARRERRTLRDLAQSLVDSESLLVEGNEAAVGEEQQA
jgi:AmiR/NasT family two-component response regulator